MSKEPFHVTEHFTRLLTLSLNERFSAEHAIMELNTRHVHQDYS